MKQKYRTRKALKKRWGLTYKMVLALNEMIIIVLGIKVFCLGVFELYIFAELRNLKKNAIQMSVVELTMKILKTKFPTAPQVASSSPTSSPIPQTPSPPQTKMDYVS